MNVLLWTVVSLLPAADPLATPSSVADAELLPLVWRPTRRAERPTITLVSDSARADWNDPSRFEQPSPWPEAMPAPTAPAPRRSWWQNLFRPETARRAPAANPFADHPSTEQPTQPRSLTLPSARPQERPSDWLLASRCRSLIYADTQLAGQSVQVDVRDGTIVLSGSVVSRTLSERAERIASKTDGAVSVRNLLAVQLPSANWNPHAGVRLGRPILEGIETADSVSSLSATLPTPEETRPVSDELAIPAQQRQVMRPRADLPSVSAYRPTRDSAMNEITVAENVSASRGIPQGRVVLWSTEQNNWAAAAPRVATAAVSPSTPMATTEERDVVPTARFVIPAPRSEPAAPLNDRRAAPASIIAPPTESAWVQTSLRPIGVTAGHAGGDTFEPLAPPAPLGASDAIASDVARRLSSDPHARGLTFRFANGELTLSGSVARSDHLYALAAELNDLPGVEFISFENLRIAP